MTNQRWTFKSSRLWGLLSGLVLVAALCFTPATGETAHAASGDCVTNGRQVTCTYEYTGAAQTWTVPDGVTASTFDLFGAQGGNTAYFAGGLGGQATATMAVTPGQTLQINVGGRGGVGAGAFPEATGGAGGFNGGGRGGDGCCTGPGGGGGASDVRTDSYALTDRLIIAGGGGGGAGATGGDGGGIAGATGGAPSLRSGTGGSGGTQSTGGLGGDFGDRGSDGEDGALGVGGAGGNGSRGVNDGSGGGGGGYYGGGGGGGGYYGSGGGGGSGYIIPSATNATLTTGVRSGHGLIIITYLLPDDTAPAITPTIVGTLGANSWYTSDVSVSWSVTDTESAISNQSGCEQQSVTSDTSGVTITCTATSAGGSSSQSVTIKRDATAPTISVAATSAPNGNGWYNSDVTVTFTCADARAGVASCPADAILSAEGSAVTSTAQTITDLAGNSSAPSNVVTVKIDKAVPAASVTGVSDGASYTLGSVPTASCETTDALSGVATQATVSVTGGNPDGSGSFTATCSGATDLAGNSAAAASVNYSVQAAGVLVGSCGGYEVRQIGNSYTAPGWSGAIKVGTNSNNTLTGTNGPDLILGLGGNDLLRGNGGDDVICGGDGVDLLQGLAGNDYLDGGPGNDVLNGGSGDYDELLAGEGNDTLLDGDGVRNATGGPGNDLFTLALRNGWRDGAGQPHFTGLTAGYGNDTVGLAILNSARFFVDISGDERDTPASPQEGNNDKLALVGVIDPASTLVKFEHRLILSADAEVAIPDEEAGAESLSEPVGETDETTGELNNRLFLPLINH